MSNLLNATEDWVTKITNAFLEYFLEQSYTIPNLLELKSINFSRKTLRNDRKLLSFLIIP